MSAGILSRLQFLNCRIEILTNGGKTIIIISTVLIMDYDRINLICAVVMKHSALQPNLDFNADLNYLIAFPISTENKSMGLSSMGTSPRPRILRIGHSITNSNFLNHKIFYEQPVEEV